MIFERTLIYSLYSPYSIYFRMVVYVDTDVDMVVSISWGPLKGSGVDTRQV